MLWVSILTVMDYYQGQARRGGGLSYWIEGEDWLGFIIFKGQEDDAIMKFTTSFSILLI